MHAYSFFIYMAIMGTCGVLDHSGIPFTIPYMYSTADHAQHHEKFDVNYGFPFPYFDMVHGTHCKKEDVND